MPPKLNYNYPVSTLLDKAIEKARDRRLVLKSCAKGSAAKANQGPQWAASAAACLVVTSARSLLLDALDPDDTEAGVFTANVSLELVLFGVECLDRVHIGELYENHAIGRRGTAQADRFVKAAGEVLAAGFFDVGLRLGQKILSVAVLIFDIDFGPRISGWIGLRVQDAGSANSQNKAADHSHSNFIVGFHCFLPP